MNVFVVFLIILAELLTLSAFKESCPSQVSWPLATWLGFFAFLLIFDSVICILQLPTSFYSSRFKSCLEALGWIIELLYLGWLCFLPLLFTEDVKTCIRGYPLLAYIMLFILLIGFLHVIKVAFFVVFMIIWAIGRMCGIQNIFGNNGSMDQLREPLYEHGQGLSKEEIADLKHEKY
jgi:hypothetical protein